MRGVEPFVENMLPKLFSPKSFETNSEIVEYTRDVMLESSKIGIIGALEAIRDRPDSTATLAQIEVPTLIIHGADDQIVSVAEAKAMQAAIPNGRLLIIPDAGHLPNLEQPDIYNDALIDFLEEVDDLLASSE